MYRRCLLYLLGAGEVVEAAGEVTVWNGRSTASVLGWGMRVVRD